MDKNSGIGNLMYIITILNKFSFFNVFVNISSCLTHNVYLFFLRDCSLVVDVSSNSNCFKGLVSDMRHLARSLRFVKVKYARYPLEVSPRAESFYTIHIRNLLHAYTVLPRHTFIESEVLNLIRRRPHMTALASKRFLGQPDLRRRAIRLRILGGRFAMTSGGP